MKRLRILILLLVSLQISLNAQVKDGEVRRVHDKGLEQQIKFTYGWEQYEITTDSLYPHYWYWTFEHLLGNYMDGDYYPNYKVTLETAAKTVVTENATDKEEKAMDTVYKEELIKDVYNMVDLAYIIEEAQILWRVDTFNYYNNKIRTLGLPQSNDVANHMNDLFIESIDKVNAIKASYIENHKRQEAYLQYEEEMDEVISDVKRVYKLMKICKNSPFEH